MYYSQDDYIIDQYQNEVETILGILTDEQKWELATMANIGHLSHANSGIEERVNMFIHYVWEQTDLCAEYTIEEQCPQRFEGVPDSGKTHDAVEKHVKRAFAAGIEYAIQWIFSEIDVYKWER